MIKYVGQEMLETEVVQHFYYFYDTITDVMYIRERVDKGPLIPMPKPSGGFLTYEEWEKAKRKNGRYIGDILIPNFQKPRL